MDDTESQPPSPSPSPSPSTDLNTGSKGGGRAVLGIVAALISVGGMLSRCSKLGCVGGKDLGSACTQGEDCSSGVCLTTGEILATGVCTRSCGADSDCGRASLRCSDGNCVPRGTKSFGASCRASHECESGICLRQGHRRTSLLDMEPQRPTGDGLCSQKCRSGEDESASAKDPGAGACPPHSICTPNADGRHCISVAFLVAASPPMTALQKGCSDGDAAACFQFAAILAGELGETEEAKQLATKSCTANHLPGCVLLAELLLRPTNPKPDEPRALALLEKACAGGEMDGCGQLAEALQKRDPKRSIALLEQVCESKDAEACDLVANRYRDGDGVARSKTKASRFAALAKKYGEKEDDTE